MKPQFDLCVIGGGGAGLTAAAGAAMLGAKVALVEKRALGGEGLHHGYVPGNTLLRSAAVAHTVRHAHRFGIGTAPPSIELAQVMERVRGVVNTLARRDSAERFERLGVEVILGTGIFVDAGTFEVGARSLTARSFVLATGSRPAVPPVEGLARTPYFTSETIFTLREAAPGLIVMGGGPMGLEMAQAFRRLGSEVDVIELAARTLPREDADLSGIVERQLVGEGVRLNLRKPVLRVEGGSGEVRVLIRDGCNGQRWLQGTHLLVATGRLPNVEGLGLERAGVRLRGGRPVIDGRLRTTNRRIYACGDIAGAHSYAHIAEHQARVVLRNALCRWPARAQTHGIPWCTFTDPEFARVGLSETEAILAGIPCHVYTYPFHGIDRAHADGATEGRAKIVLDTRGRILGAAIVGPQAGELIHEYALAISKKLKASDLAGVIRVYPTLSQINRHLADQYLKEQAGAGVRHWLRRLLALRAGSSSGCC